MKKEKSLHEELEDISPFLLRQKSKREGYEVPSDYFRALPDEVMEKLSPNRTAPALEREDSRWFRNGLALLLQGFFRPRYALASMTVALLLAAGAYLWNTREANLPDSSAPLAMATLDEVPVEVLQSYIAANIDDFDEAILITALPDAFTPPLQKQETNELDDELLLDELIESSDLDELEEFL